MTCIASFWQTITPVEIGVLIIVVWELLWGMKRGLGGELVRLVATILTLLIGWRFYEPAGRFLAKHSFKNAHSDIAPAAAFLMIVVSLCVLFYVLGLVLRWLASLQFNDRINRRGGAVAGLLRGLLLSVLCIYAVALWPQAAVQEWVVQRSPVGGAVYRWTSSVVARVKAVQLDDAFVPPLPEQFEP